MKPKHYPYSGKQKASIEVTIDTEKLSNVLDKALDTSFQVQNRRKDEAVQQNAL